MKRILLVVTPVCFIVSIVLTLYFMYRFGLFKGIKIADQARDAVDNYLLESYKKRSPVGRTVQNIVFNNDDKYVFRPARIVDAHTAEGRQAFEVYGMVEGWNPGERTLAVNTYIGKKITVVFDPSVSPASAYVPLLDKYGQIVDFGENGIVTSTDNEKFPTLFCVGDIVSLVANDKQAIEKATLDTPLIPLEIHLSHRLCEQAP